MSRRERSQDGFWPKVMVATIVVIWVSLVAGNWLGNYAIGMLSGKETEPTEFKQDLMRGARPRPWQKVDPKLQEEVDRQRARLTGEKPRPQPQEVVTASPVPPDAKATATSTPEPAATAEPPAPEATPADVSVAPTPEQSETPAEPTPTPAAPASDAVELQFGSFSSEENAKQLIDELAKQGQNARLEAVPTDNGTVYRVRGGGFTGEEQAKSQLEKLREQGIDAFVVNP